MQVHFQKETLHILKRDEDLGKFQTSFDYYFCSFQTERNCKKCFAGHWKSSKQLGAVDPVNIYYAQPVQLDKWLMKDNCSHKMKLGGWMCRHRLQQWGSNWSILRVSDTDCEPSFCNCNISNWSILLFARPDDINVSTSTQWYSVIALEKVGRG